MISKVAANFIKNNSTNFLSGLANNSDSIMPMLVKDTISNGAIVYTYSKEGGQDDAREKFIEEFGTGAVWLLSIPTIKKIFDLTIYKKLNLDSNLDTKVILSDVKNNTKNVSKKPNSSNKFINFIQTKLLSDGVDKETTKKLQQNLLNSDNPVLAHEKEVIKTLNETNPNAKNIPFLKNLTNAQLYKSLFATKFVLATALSGALLVKIIKAKQKSTDERIKKDFMKNNASRVLVNGNLSKNDKYQTFTNKIKTNPNNKTNSPSFTGLKNVASAFMYNPILNTSLLDGVITTTRLKEARKGERKEVALKEAFQIFFIYALAKPVQKVFETIGSKINCPIELDPKILFSQNVKDDVAQSMKYINENLKNGSEYKQGLVEEIYNLANTNPKHSLISLLDKEGVITTIKEDIPTKHSGFIGSIEKFFKNSTKDVNKNDIVGISYLKPVSEDSLKSTLGNIENLSKNISNLKGIKTAKILATFGNIAFAAWAMGRLQPKVNIWMRKALNHGDNRNPAIVQREKEMQLKQQQNFNA